MASQTSLLPKLLPHPHGTLLLSCLNMDSFTTQQQADGLFNALITQSRLPKFSCVEGWIGGVVDTVDWCEENGKRFEMNGFFLAIRAQTDASVRYREMSA